MKQVQDALRNIGIPVMAGVWRPTTSSQNPPVQYVVYSTTTTEATHSSCYTCLRSYGNQKYHDILDRSLAWRYFDRL